MRYIAPLVTLLIFISATTPHLSGGFGVLCDSEAIYEVHRDILEGNYIPSRSVGFPLYEIPVAHVLDAFGLVGANAYSLAMTLAFLGVVYMMLRGKPNGMVLFPALALYPLVIANATVLMETAQGMMLMAIATMVAEWHDTRKNIRFLVLLAAFNLLAVLTRLDYVFFSAAVTCALLVKADQQWNDRAKLLGAMVISGVAFLIAYGMINNGVERLLTTSVMQHDAVWRKVVRAGLGYVALLGLPASACLGVLALRHFRTILRHLASFSSLPFSFRFFAFMLFFYTIRFVMLPDKLDYVIPLYLAFILFASEWTMARPVLVGLAVCILSLNFVTFSLFDRGENNNLHLKLAINPGAYTQNVDVRQAKKIQSSGGFYNYYEEQMQRIAWRIGEQREMMCMFRPIETMLRPCDTVVVPVAMLYRLTAERFPLYPDKEMFKRIIAIETNIIPFFFQNSRVTNTPMATCDGTEAWQQLKSYTGFNEFQELYRTGGNLRYRVIPVIPSAAAS